MSDQPPVTVRMLALLDGICRTRGLPSTLYVDVLADGIQAGDLAVSLGFPLDQIEGVFHNNTVAGLDSVVMPGDRVAYVSRGTPASHPSFFGQFTTRPRG